MNNELKSFAPVDAEKVQEDIRDLFNGKACLEIAMEIARVCSKDIKHILTKHRIKNAQSFAQEIGLVNKVCTNALPVITRFGLKVKDGAQEAAAQRAVKQINAFSTANFITLFVCAASIPPHKLDAFCDEVEALTVKIKQQCEDETDLAG